MGLRYKKKYDLDDPKTTLAHRDIIKSKPFLKKLYEEWYGMLMTKCKTVPAGKMLEIGSGGGFLKEIFSDVITSDILPLDCCDKIVSAEELPFANEELSAIMMVNVLHHIPHPEKFLQEAERTLKTGGKILMVEPANSWFARFIYQHFHHEPFHPEGNWEVPSTGPLSGANGAIPWIIFERDKNLFEKKFPQLKLNPVLYHTPFRYLLSGGVSMKALVPKSSFGFFKMTEKIASPLSRVLGMFVFIEITKVASKK
ncbi:MAG TPA: class I SAM-dependent methyltransferase [Bacteroidia bacterium]|nr:class I SAM-dependent methyltransferase [Bacteroidia bacterium]